MPQTVTVIVRDSVLGVQMQQQGASSSAQATPAYPQMYLTPDGALMQQQLTHGTQAFPPLYFPPGGLDDAARQYFDVVAAQHVMMPQQSSCHQCKTTKSERLLLFCTAQPDKDARKRKCRKKYCPSQSTHACSEREGHEVYGVAGGGAGDANASSKLTYVSFLFFVPFQPVRKLPNCSYKRS
jgi:hypothetical protein